MRKHEASRSRSANQSRGLLRPLAVVAALALAACSSGRETGNSATPSNVGPNETRLLIDCQRNPQARHSFSDIGDEENPARVGNTWIVGTFDETAPVTTDGKPDVKAGVRVAYRGGHMYSAEPINSPGSGSAEIKSFNSADPTAGVNYSFGGANFNISMVSEPRFGVPHNLGIVATVACAGAPRP